MSMALYTLFMCERKIHQNENVFQWSGFPSVHTLAAHIHSQQNNVKWFMENRIFIVFLYLLGQYSLVEPDGSIRTVDYTADSINGFNAV